MIRRAQRDFDFSVVIPAYNEEKLLPFTLAHLNSRLDQLNEYHGEIIVVDNASTDQTIEIALEKGAKVIKESERSIARTRNKGAGEAQGAILIFIDADTIVPLEVLREALDLMRNPLYGGGGATVKFDQNQGRFISGVLVPEFWNLISRFFKLAAGSFIYCRAEDFEKIGGFSEKLYAGEEIQFIISLKRILRRSRKRFVILHRNPVITSSRKLVWYGDLKIFSTLFLLLLFPFAIRFKRFCNFWYQRP